MPRLAEQMDREVCLSFAVEDPARPARQRNAIRASELKIRFFRTPGRGLSVGRGSRAAETERRIDNGQQVEFKGGGETRTGLSYGLQVRSIANIPPDCGSVFIPKVSSCLEESIRRLRRLELEREGVRNEANGDGGQGGALSTVIFAWGIYYLGFLVKY